MLLGYVIVITENPFEYHKMFNVGDIVIVVYDHSSGYVFPRHSEFYSVKLYKTKEKASEDWELLKQCLPDCRETKVEFKPVYLD